MAQDLELQDFLPYALNQAAEAASAGFRRVYKARYGMLRTEWRVLFHLGACGPLTARAICDKAGLHKTKVSRAVQALEARRFLIRTPDTADRRHEFLALTAAGRAAYRDLVAQAKAFDAMLSAQFSESELSVLRDCLRRLAVAGPHVSTDLSARARRD